jgi:pimeloyl-ACP methyl ester carboxylesterase
LRGARFARSADGAALAWIRSGTGPPLVKAANWLTHLEHDATSPVWSHWVNYLEGHFDYLRYDERGCGLSDRATKGLGVDTWVGDLEAVVAASQISTPFVLLGISHGAATGIAFANRHPELVSHLVLYGGYARGAFRRENAQAAQLFQAIVDVFRLGFDSPNTAFQEVFTSRFIPKGTPDQRQWFNDLCRRTTTAEAGTDLLLSRAEIDITAELERVSVPTLIVHVRDDAVTQVAESELMARAIPGAELRVIAGSNHVLLQDEPAWPEFCSLLLDFTGAPDAGRLVGLTDRELEILRLICRARSNKQIAAALDLSEKTVRNHASNIFAKLNVHSRQEAMVAASRAFPG